MSTNKSEKNTTASKTKKTLQPATPKSPFLAPVEQLWPIILEEVAENVRERNMDVSLVDSLAAARDLVMNRLLPECGAKSVSFGGSMTILQAGLLEALKARQDLSVLDTFDHSPPPEERLELRRQALLCDLYLTSVNALSRDGVLMLLDGTGNRTAAVQFGPKKVILLVSRNKICSSVEEGFDRVRNFAAPANTIRLNKKTPCVKTGRCMDCKSPERICSFWTLIERNSSFPKRIHVILINEDAGF